MRLAVGLACALTAPLIAGPAPRTRVSRDLEQFLTRGGQSTARVIVHGAHADLEALAARHGATVRSLLANGAVLEVTRAQLAALSLEDALDHVSGDVDVTSMLTLTNKVTAADQARAATHGRSG
jgi:hypothetical protein